jgi:signal transduction histidine kinase
VGQLGFGWISTKIGVMAHIFGRVKFTALIIKFLLLGTFVLVVSVSGSPILDGKHPFVNPAYSAAGDSQITMSAESGDDGPNQTAFWESWWFIVLVGLILGASVVIGYRWRFHFIEQNRQRLAVEVFERTEEIERRRQMAAGLSDIVRLLNSNQPLEMSLDFIVQQAVGLTEASKAAIFERQDDLVVVRACYPPGETYLLDLNNPDSTSARCLLESTFLNKPLILSRIDPTTMKSDTRWELVSGDYRTALCTPLVVDEAVYGGLVLYYGQERAFTPEEVRFAHTLADQASLAITNAQLKINAQEAAVIAERNRLARELHDAVTQTLFSASLIADVLPKLWDKDPQQAQGRLEELQQLTRGALGEMRTLLMELRPSALSEADPGELLKHLADAFTGRTGLPVHFDLEVLDPCIIPTDVKLVFYRIAQEGLSNILKHAQAGQVWMHFRCDLETVDFALRDDGLGFSPDQLPPGHLGLGIMKERAESVGAALTFSSHPGEGTALVLVWHFRKNWLK